MFENLKRWWIELPMPLGSKIIATVVIVLIVLGVVRRLLGL
jgi:hypothetical protein